MTTLLTLAAVLGFAWGWHAVKGFVRRGGFKGRRPGRWATMFAVAVLLGLQAVATAPSASAAACGQAPTPERPGSGMVGAIDPPATHGENGSAYLDYGYAGMVWYVYQTDCGPLSGITSPNSTIDTWAGNELFNIGKNIVGATNSLHYTVMEGGLLNPIYGAVKSGAEKVYNNIYAQLFGLAALVLAIMMFRNIWRGDLSAVSKRALYGLGAVWLAASSLAMLRYFEPIDKAIVQTTTNIQAGFVDDSGNRVVREILPTELHTQVVYDNWLRGEFGASDAAQAQQFGRPLLDAQAFTWDQIRNGDDANQSVIDAKQASYKNIAGQLGPATPYFTGEGGSRTGAGFLALLQSLVYALFQLLAKASVLLAQVLIRLFALTAPLIGLVALVHHDILRRVGKVLGGVAFNLIVLAVLAGVHALLLQAIFAAGNSLSMLTQMVMAGLVTVLLFLVGRPVRRLWQMVEMSVGMVGSSIPAPSGGIFSRFRRKQGPTPQDEFWQNVRDSDDSDLETRGPIGATAGGRRDRPEATIFANAQRLDGAGSMAARPAAAWSGAPWPGGGSLPGNGNRRALPAGGGPGVYPAYAPSARAPGDDAYVYSAPPGSTRRVDAGWVPPQPQSRRVDTSPVFNRDDLPDSVVVPSRLRSTPPAPHRTSAPQPRRAERELVGGKPVFVLYRPSRGIEVRDTDEVVR
ncbi:magnesium transporter [Amycolatopsis alkalitolerans]|uniref:Magnesium transporter n=1 Tax=Amycolatopsis alkalitolerans TaxID=2547244 RepID=A0A5C4LYT2_9PSEU|nr:magnesium transporter [Amycolatopsis alkalitolerans]TNC23143.1 magnesium transporter [Amycolatopsis alkalitolerans]